MSSYAYILGALGVFLGAACGGTDAESSGSGASSASSGTGGAGGTGSSSSGGLMLGCDPACVAPQTCSAANVCIDPDTCAADADCSPGTVCDLEKKACVPGGCVSQEVKVEPIPPNLLIVLDRSCSMTSAVGDSDKWTIAVSAIKKMTTNFKADIRFGLSLFPDLVGDSCTQDAVAIPVAAGNEAEIKVLLTASLDKADKYYPDGPCSTNIDTAMKQAAAEPYLGDAERDSYVLLLTDGKQSTDCDPNKNADQKTTNTITNLFKTKGVPTFVLGFGSGIDPAQMDKFAQAGGMPSDGAHKYYDASDEMSLDMALDMIAKKTLTCSYKLGTVPANADEVYVFFNNVTPEIPRDVTHTEGWDYDMATNQVIFYGASCEGLKSGAVTDLDIVLGCPALPPN